MKITNARLIICSPDRNFVTLKIETDAGIYGLGDATLNGRELAVAVYLTEHVLPCLIGRDPFWRRGPVTMSAIGAVDVALWDIKGKALNTPVYNLLGGKSRNGVLVYTHANGRDIEEAVDSVRQHMEEGTWRSARRVAYRALRAVMESLRAASHMNLQSEDFRVRAYGPLSATSTSFPASLKGCGWSWVRMCICSMTSITG
jgi:L-alanine-DL-glutamate epimerase-like enolase superfamily enzyme